MKAPWLLPHWFLSLVFLKSSNCPEFSILPSTHFSYPYRLYVCSLCIYYLSVFRSNQYCSRCYFSVLIHIHLIHSFKLLKSPYMAIHIFTNPFFFGWKNFPMFCYYTKSSMEIIFFMSQHDKRFKIKILHADENYW